MLFFTILNKMKINFFQIITDDELWILYIYAETKQQREELIISMQKLATFHATEFLQV